MWQGAVLIVQAAPHTPDMVALANAMADDEAEPSMEAIWAAADAQALAGEGVSYVSKALV